MRTHLSRISDTNLLNNFSLMVRRERMATGEVIVHLAEIYRRRLYAKEGFSSLFAYIQVRYHYSGSAAYRRIQVARLSLQYPEVIRLLEAGKVNLQGLCLIEPHMTSKNGTKLIEQTIGKTKQEIEYLLAHTFQRVEKTQDKLRRLPVIKKVIPIQFNSPRKEQSTAAAAVIGHPERNAPPTKTIEIRRVKLECVIDEAVANKLERAREVLRKKYPQGRFEDILNEALEALLEKKDPERKIKRAEKTPRSSRGVTMEGRGMTSQARNDRRKIPASTGMTHSYKTRYIPQHIRRGIWKRDKGHCTFKSTDGRPCHERGNLEIDHIRPFSLGGGADLGNLRLLCATHNRYRAVKTFGRSPGQAGG